jgi:hypothetical protein
MGWDADWYGNCSRCGHDWREHLEGEGCSECEYEIEHEDPDAPAQVCEERPGGRLTEYHQPIRERAYVDTDGVRWNLRRGELRWKRVERLAADPALGMLWVYADTIREIPVDERPEVLRRIRPYVEGRADGPGHTDFRIGEFRDGGYRSLLIIEESC